MDARNPWGQTGPARQARKGNLRDFLERHGGLFTPAVTYELDFDLVAYLVPIQYAQERVDTVYGLTIHGDDNVTDLHLSEHGFMQAS